MDVRLTREQIHPRVFERAFDERVRTRGPSADWVAVRVAELEDLPLALSLVREAVQANSQRGDVSGGKRKSSITTD
jgi:hypothetical protein